MKKATFLKNIGANIAKKRKQKGWSRAYLARVCDKKMQSIERVENGKVNPSLYYLYEIASGLQIPLKELLDMDIPFKED